MPFDLDSIHTFSRGYALIRVKTGNEVRGIIIDESGMVAIDPDELGLDNIIVSFPEGVAAVTLDEPKLGADYANSVNHVKQKARGMYGIIDKTGRLVIDYKYYGVPIFKGNGVANVYLAHSEKELFVAMVDFKQNGKILDKGDLIDIFFFDVR